MVSEFNCGVWAANKKYRDVGASARLTKRVAIILVLINLLKYSGISEIENNSMKFKSYVLERKLVINY